MFVPVASTAAAENIGVNLAGILGGRRDRSRKLGLVVGYTQKKNTNFSARSAIFFENLANNLH